MENESLFWNVYLLLPWRQILKLLTGYVDVQHINQNFL